MRDDVWWVRVFLMANEIPSGVGAASEIWEYGWMDNLGSRSSEARVPSRAEMSSSTRWAYIVS